MRIFFSIFIFLYSVTSVANTDINESGASTLKGLINKLTTSLYYQDGQPTPNAAKPALDEFISSIKAPSLSFVPNKEFDLNASFNSTPYQYTLSNTGGSPVNFSEIFTLENSSVALCDKAYKNQANRLAAGSSSSMQLSSQIDSFMLGFLDMENQIKSSISSQINDTFASLVNLFSEEFIMHQTFKIFSKQQAKMMCNTCKETLVGCNQIFLIANSMSQVAEDAALKEKIAAMASQSGTHKQSGSIAEIGVGSICTNIPILVTPSGYGKSIMVSKYVEYSDKIALYAKANKSTIMDGAMEQCVKWATNKSRKWMEKILKTATQKIILSVETQNQCLEENSNPETVYQKNTKLRDASERDLFSSLNNSIGSFNDKAIKFTDTLVKNYNNSLKLLTRNPTPDPDAVREQIAETLNASDSADGNYMRIDRIIENSINDLHSSNISASSIQVIRKLLKDTQLSSLLLPHYKQLGKDAFSNINGSVKVPDNDASYNIIRPIYNSFAKNLDFYKNTLTNDFLKKPYSVIPFLTCQNFDPITTTDSNVCFNHRYKERLGMITQTGTPATCNCVSYTNSIDIIRNPAILAADLITQKKESISEIINDKLVIKNTDHSNLLSAYKKELDDLEIKFIEDLATYLANIQANQMNDLTKLPLEQVNSIRGLFYNILAEVL